MNIENLTVGMRIRNYPELCVLLNEKINTGKSKQLQIKRWEQYFKYHRDGHTFVIDEIYEQSLPTPPRKLRCDNIYAHLIESIMMDRLNNEREIKTGKRELCQFLGFFNENYSNINSDNFKNTMRQFQERGITGHIMTTEETQSYYTDFYKFTQSKFNDILMSALESMQRRNLIYYKKTFSIIEEATNEKQVMRNTNNEEDAEILCLLDEFYKNYPHFYCNVNPYMIYAYYAELDKWIRKNKKNWLSVRPLIYISISDNSPYRQENEDSQLICQKKLKLNRIIMEKLNKHFCDEFKKAKNENRVLQNDWIQWGESNKMNSKKYYTSDFQEAQSSLINLFIKIDANDTLNKNEIQMEEAKMNTNMNSNSCVVINAFPVLIKEYHNQRVVTFRDIDTVHGRPDGTASRNFRKNRNYFIEGEDYFKITPDEFRRTIGDMDKRQQNDVTLITESGYLMLVKSFTDDLAWEVQRQLVNTYFKSKEIVKQQFNQDVCHTSLMKDKISKWKRQVSNPLIERLQSLLTDYSLGQTYACIYREMKKNFDFDGNTCRLAYSSKYNIPIEECAIIDAIAVDNVLRKQFLQCLSSYIKLVTKDQVEAALETQENCLEMIARKEQCNAQLDNEFNEVFLISECNC